MAEMFTGRYNWNDAQKQQVQQQLERIRAAAAEAGDQWSEAQLWAHAENNVASANNVPAQPMPQGMPTQPDPNYGGGPASGPGGQTPGAWNPPVDIGTAPGAIQGQAYANQWLAQQQAMYNRPNERGPYGSATYKFNPETGQLERNYELSENQALLNAQREEQDVILGGEASKAAGRAQDTLKDPYSYGGMSGVDVFDMTNAGPMPDLQYDQSRMPQASQFAFGQGPQWQGYQGLGQMPSGSAEDRARIEEETYGRFARNMEPRFTEEKDSLRQQLADQGIPQGSKLYERELSRLEDRQEESRQDARSQAVQLGGQELGREFGMGLQSRQQAVGEQASSYGMTAADRERMTSELQAQYGMSADEANRYMQQQENMFGAGMQGRQQYQAEQEAGQQYSTAERNRQIQEMERQRYAPLQEQQMLAGAQRGVMNPQWSQMGQIGFNPIDVTGTGMGFAQLGQQWDIAQMQNATQRNLAGLAGAEGGGGAPSNMNYFGNLFSGWPQQPQQQAQGVPWWAQMGNAVGTGFANAAAQGF